MYTFQYFASAAAFRAALAAGFRDAAATMVRTVDAADFDPGANLARQINDNSFWDQLACCSSEMDRTSYNGCYLRVTGPGLPRPAYFELFDSADGGARVEMRASLLRETGCITLD